MKFFVSAVKEVLLFIVLAVVIVIPIRTFIAQPFIVQGESMHPTFGNSDYLIIDQLSYRFHQPLRGDVVVFRAPPNPSLFYIKRVIGLPHETITIDHGVVHIIKEDGSTLDLQEPYVVTEDATYTLTTTLGADQYFVMGDNRPNSSDSRIWGALDKKEIIGHVFTRLIPVTKAGIDPGSISLPQ